MAVAHPSGDRLTVRHLSARTPPRKSFSRSTPVTCPTRASPPLRPRPLPTASSRWTLN